MKMSLFACLGKMKTGYGLYFVCICYNHFIKKHERKGLWVLLSIGITLAIGVVVGYIVYSQKGATAETRWVYDSQKDKWNIRGGSAPVCKEPFVFDYSPVDLTFVTNVGFPGTYRGKDYKVHGTFSLSKSSTVQLPADATLSGMVRYYEGEPAELQYKVSFEMDCGIAFYFDHLYTLSPQLQTLADQLPKPKLNDTRVDSHDAPPRMQMKAGDIVAIETGAHQARRYGIDFGVIDYRQRNAISGNPQWAALHGNFKASEWYGVCWFGMLPGDDAEKAKQLSAVQFDTRRTIKLVSDYCDTADYRTLDFFNGKPVDAY